MKSASGNPYPMFKVSYALDAGEDIFRVNSCCYYKVRVEPYRATRPPPQCFRCQQYHHTVETCREVPRCRRCAEEHLTRLCRQPEEAPALCALCSGSHCADSTECPCFLAAMESIDPSRRRKSNRTNNRNRQQQQQHPRGQAAASQIGSRQQHTSWAAAAAPNVNRQQHVLGEMAAAANPSRQQHLQRTAAAFATTNRQQPPIKEAAAIVVADMQQHTHRGAAAATMVNRQQHLPGVAAVATNRAQQQPRAEAAAIQTPQVNSQTNTRNSPQTPEPSFSIITTQAEIHAPPTTQARFRYEGGYQQPKRIAVGGTRERSVQLP